MFFHSTPSMYNVQCVMYVICNWYLSVTSCTTNKFPVLESHGREGWWKYFISLLLPTQSDIHLNRQTLSLSVVSAKSLNLIYHSWSETGESPHDWNHPFTGRIIRIFKSRNRVMHHGNLPFVYTLYVNSGMDQFNWLPAPASDLHFSINKLYFDNFL